jgi:hypothetical protein
MTQRIQAQHPHISHYQHTGIETNTPQNTRETNTPTFITWINRNSHRFLCIKRQIHQVGITWANVKHVQHILLLLLLLIIIIIDLGNLTVTPILKAYSSMLSGHTNYSNNGACTGRGSLLSGWLTH